MTDTVDEWTLTDDVEQQNDVFVRAFNSGDGKIFDSLYHDDAISNLSGQPLTGRERADFAVELLAQGPTLSATVRESFRTGDTSLLVVDYVMEAAGPSGETVRMTGTCTDVMTRDRQGRWKMAIDRPVPDKT